MSSDQQPQPQILEVEDVEQRQKRLRMYLCFLIPRFSPKKKNLLWSAETILERLNAEGSSANESPNVSFDFGVRRTFAIEPPDACARHRTLCLTNRKLAYTLP